ncbi:helicase-related protein [soil metagenome]
MPLTPTLTAVLGPTNTGKTHLAVERMLGHGSGMIGLPLRLLAREIYDRVRLRAGDHATALVTGEEKIIPAKPRFWICTVEAMPSDIDVAFLAIDEIQLAADFERGHILTDPILQRCGREETMLLGAGTMRPMIEALLPDATIIARPRFSKLTYAGQKKLSRLPRRSAIVAFSAQTVYAVAELIRRQRGGAAVVLGALSPRSRNAQVALYQSGDVDYIVATDAIGMGLNMDVDHVAFAATRKFDGFQFRHLNPAELAQVAGRAGRHLNDGTFGATGEAEPFDAALVEQLETHRFDPVRMLQWRNRDLDFASVDALRKSLNVLPNRQGMARAQSGPDLMALEALARDETVVSLATTRKAVARLWEVCQIPDYRDISANEHAGLVGRVFEFLMTGDGFIPDEWISRQLAHCDRSDGDLDTLSNRLSHVRTWTFIANRADWLEAPLFWQSRAREIEDKLSDALHERLTQRFIDRRTSVLMKRLARKEDVMSSVEEDGAIHVEGEYAGRISGFRFVPDAAGGEGKAVQAAALKAVAAEIAARAQAVAVCPDPQLSLTRRGRIVWQNADIAQLEAGASLLKPKIVLLAGDQLTGPERDAVQERLEKFLSRHIAAVLEPLVKLEESETLTGITRGLAFRLVETLGILPRDQVADDVKGLAQEERASLRTLGVRFGAFNLFIPALLKPAATELRLLLWGLQKAKTDKFDLETLPPPPGQGLTSTVFDRTTPRGYYGVCGYRICGTRSVRIDMLERLADLIRDRVFWRARFPEQPRPLGSVEGGGFTIMPDMMSLVGCAGEEFQAILRSLDFRSQKKKVKAAPKPVPPTEAPAEAVPEVSPESLAEIRVDASVEPVAVIETAPSEGPAAEPALDVSAEPAAVIDAAPSEPHATEPAIDVATEPAAIIDSAPSEEHAAEPALDVSAEPAAAIEESPPETPAVADAPPPAPTEPEEIEIEVWWPKDTGPFRKAPEARPPQPNRRPERNQRKKEAESKPDVKPDVKLEPAKSDRPRTGRPKPKYAKPEQPKPERPPKPVDPDSPFAILSELRAKLVAKKS